MTIAWIILLSPLALCIPIIIYYYWYATRQDKLQHVVLSFTMPTGQGSKMAVKAGPSGSIIAVPLLFPSMGPFVMLFRGQYLEFIIWFLGVDLISTLILFFGVFHGTIPTGEVEITTPLSTMQIVWLSAIMILKVIPIYVFSLTSNKTRIRSLIKKGYDYESCPENDVDAVRNYISDSRVPKEELGEGVKRGQTHDYVVPENNVVEDDPNDYTHLTVQDLKLLLKSEGIAFSPEYSKEDLLKLCEEYLYTEPKKKPDPTANLTIAQLMDKLDEKEIKYKKSATKDELKQLLKDSNKKGQNK